MFRYYLFDINEVQTEITERVQQGWAANPGTSGIVMNAEEGTTGMWSLDVEDPGADLTELVGHRRLTVVEDTLTADDFGGQVGYGFIGDRRVNRRPGSNLRTEDRRLWTAAVTDINTIFERRIFVGKDCRRPAETDIARITWALSTAECALITGDDTYIETSGAVDMDAVDYTGQSVRQVFDDCAQQSGRNWFLIPFSPSGPTLFYDERASSAFASALQISNVITDVDGVTTFYPAMGSELTRDPSRVYSGVYVAFDGGYSYVQRQATYEEFARRDTFSPSENVKTAAKAKNRGLRYLRDIATEEDTISTAIIVPRSLANGVVAGQRMQVKFSHLPGYEAFVWMRVLNTTKRELGPDQVEIAMELIGDEPAPAGPPVYGILRLAKGPFGASHLVNWAQPGDTQPPGYPHQPTVGAIEVMTGGTTAGWSYTGWKVTGTGTIDVTYFTSIVGVVMCTPIDNPSPVYTITFALLLNGVTIASYTVNYQLLHGFAFVQKYGTVTVSALAVVPDDTIQAVVQCTPGMPFFRTPAGTGQSGERLEITGGSLS